MEKCETRSFDPVVYIIDHAAIIYHVDQAV